VGLQELLFAMVAMVSALVLSPHISNMAPSLASLCTSFYYYLGEIKRFIGASKTQITANIIPGRASSSLVLLYHK
jgi:hypothetical protein